MIQGFIILFVVGRELFNLSKLIKNKRDKSNINKENNAKEAESI
jgi:hypothetical protein